MLLASSRNNAQHPAIHKIALQNEELYSLKCQWCQGEKSWVKGSNQSTPTEGQEDQLKGPGLGQAKGRK